MTEYEEMYKRCAYCASPAVQKGREPRLTTCTSCDENRETRLFGRLPIPECEWYGLRK
jgi:hypothetical protein